MASELTWRALEVLCKTSDQMLHFVKQVHSYSWKVGHVQGIEDLQVSAKSFSSIAIQAHRKCPRVPEAIAGIRYFVVSAIKSHNLFRW